MKIITISIFSIIFLISCSKQLGEQNSEKDNEHYVKTHSTTVNKVDSLSIFDKFKNHFNCQEKLYNEEYEFNYCEKIDFDFAVKFLNQNSSENNVEIYSDEIIEYENGYVVTYYITCGIGGFCYGKELALINKIDKKFIDKFVLNELFGDFEKSVRIESQKIDKWSFLRKTIRVEASIETLDTLSIDIEKDTLVIQPKFNSY